MKSNDGAMFDEIRTTKSDAEFQVEISGEIVKQTNNAAERIMSLSEKYKEALHVLTSNQPILERAWFDWMDETKKYVTIVQQTRMAMQSECRATVAAIKDVSDILGSEKVNADCKKLRELIELCERAKALRESGFLDAVVDTLLKVETNGISNTING